MDKQRSPKETGVMEDAELQHQLEKYHAAGFGWALSCCRRNMAEAEDILQTVYVKILEGKARYNGKAAFKTWFFSVIRKTAAEFHRKKVLRAFKLLEFKQSPVTVSAGPYERVYESQRQEKFVQALTSLSRRQREVLQLVFYHDFTLAEAAAVMGIFIGSARTHYERGKQRLRELLEEPKNNESQRSN